MKLFKKPRLPEACNPELPEQLAQNCAVEFLEDLHSTFSTYRTLLGRSLAQYKSRKVLKGRCMSGATTHALLTDLL